MSIHSILGPPSNYPLCTNNIPHHHLCSSCHTLCAPRALHHLASPARVTRNRRHARRVGAPTRVAHLWRFRQRPQQATVHRSVPEGTRQPERLSIERHLLCVARMDRLQPGAESVLGGSRNCVAHHFVSVNQQIYATYQGRDTHDIDEMIPEATSLRKNPITNHSIQSISMLFTIYNMSLPFYIFAFFCNIFSDEKFFPDLILIYNSCND